MLASPGKPISLQHSGTPISSVSTIAARKTANSGSPWTSSTGSRRPGSWPIDIRLLGALNWAQDPFGAMRGGEA